MLQLFIIVKSIKLIYMEDIMDIVFFIILLIPLIFIGVVILGSYILKRIIKPDKELLTQLENLKGIKRINAILLILSIGIILIDSINYIFYIFILVSIITQIISIKIRYNYLKNIEECNNTRKYVLIQFIIFTIFLIVAGAYIFYFNYFC